MIEFRQAENDPKRTFATVRAVVIMLRNNNRKPASCEARDAIYGENNVQETWIWGWVLANFLDSLIPYIREEKNER